MLNIKEVAMRRLVSTPKRRSDAARMLADRRYANRVVSDKTKYSRKGRLSPKKFGDSIKPVIAGRLIEFVQHRGLHGNLSLADNRPRNTENSHR